MKQKFLILACLFTAISFSVHAQVDPCRYIPEALLQVDDMIVDGQLARALQVLNGILADPDVKNCDNLKYVKRKKAEVEEKIRQQSNSNSSSPSTQSYRACPDSNHPHLIDLGLPSGTKWACCNVGASRPEDYGNYYAWGETTPKSTYDWSNYKWCRGAYDKQTKYCTKSSYGTVDNKTVLEPGDDAARANWGASWRMPTKAQCQELLDKCTHIWTKVNGVRGRKFTGPNGASIFLPAAGWRIGAGGTRGSSGGYWSSTLNESSPYNAFELYFNSGYANCLSENRNYGPSVRPVRSN